MSSDKSRTIYLVKRVEIEVRNRLDATLENTSLTAGQYTVLSLLNAMPKTSSAEVSRRAGVTPQTISETIALFEKRGLIERTLSPNHKRVLQINLTAKGQSLITQCEQQVDAMEKKLLIDLNPRDVKQLRGLLTRILAS